MAKKDYSDGLSFYKRKKKISYKAVHEVLSWLLSVLITVFLATALVMLFGMEVFMAGSSMRPGIEPEQDLLIDRFSYVLGKPHAGHVVIFLPNGNENSYYYTKRVVACPGDTVQIKNGRLYVNGELSEYIESYISDPGIAENELTLENNEYFLMGDNPSESEDSRSSGIGPVLLTDIKGHVWFKLPVEGGKMGIVR
ncbi:MAG: signal peptidase I [Lachnospiraceae bacterium]|nr:signal peptidase I [Lachnospiraceae bacterium]